MKLKTVLFGIFAAAIATTAGFGASKPNIILIYADDLGYGDVSCYGATRVKTPNVDRLAKEGLRFTDGHASSATCTPSRYSMLTGEYAWRKKGTGILPSDAALIIQPGRTTLPSILQKAGYQTGVVGKWHLGLSDGTVDWNGDIKPGPLEIGFNYCFLLPATGDRVPCVYIENHRIVNLDPKDPLSVDYNKKVGNEPTGKENPEKLKLHPAHGHDQTIVNGISRIGYMSGGHSAWWVDEDIADVLTKKATSFIDKNKSQPFFLFFSLHDIHVPRTPHSRFAGKSPMGARGDVILQMDWCVGEILNALEKQNLAKDTIVIFSSDNGPVVNDGYKDEAVEKLGDHKPAGPLRGGKYSIYEGGTRVPFIVRWPGHVKPGTSDAVVCQIDFAASFAELTGQKLAKDEVPDSFNVLPALLGESKTGRQLLVEQASTLALRQGNWKYIPADPDPKGKAKRGNSSDPQLFNLADDVEEKNNIADKNSDKVKELDALLNRIRSAGRSRDL